MQICTGRKITLIKMPKITVPYSKGGVRDVTLQLGQLQICYLVTWEAAVDEASELLACSKEDCIAVTLQHGRLQSSYLVTGEAAKLLPCNRELLPCSRGGCRGITLQKGDYISNALQPRNLPCSTGGCRAVTLQQERLQSCNLAATNAAELFHCSRGGWRSVILQQVATQCCCSFAAEEVAQLIPCSKWATVVIPCGKEGFRAITFLQGMQLVGWKSCYLTAVEAEELLRETANCF